MKTATYIKALDWHSDARLYKLSEPIVEHDWEGNVKGMYTYVIVSAVDAFGTGDETYIFPSDENGEPVHMLELAGSFKGSQDHAKALRNAGYVIA